MTSLASYSAPSGLPLNSLGARRRWTVTRHAVIATSPAPDRVPLPGPRREPCDGAVRPWAVDPVPCPARRRARQRTPAAPTSARDASGTVDGQRTYQLIRQSGAIDQAVVEIEFLAAGLEAYCFTFG